MRVASNLRPDPGAATAGARLPPLVAHVIYRLDVGGLENGVVNLINHISPARYRHAVVCLTDASDFSRRIKRSDVPVFRLRKPPGNSPATLFRLWQLFRQLRPDIVHTRNLAALESAVPAALAGVPIRIHGEHGRDVEDLDGSNLKRRRLRRLFRPFVHRYITVSRDLGVYLERKVGVPANRIAQIYNGVDSALFHPAQNGRESLPWPNAQEDGLFVIGSVGRMQTVKDPLNLVRAFILLLQACPAAAPRLRLVMVGDGPLRDHALETLRKAGCADRAWLPGGRDDVARIMRGFDLFVLPSLAEGVSNTLLEAMASGLPVIATAVGGNPELVQPGVTGVLVPPANPEAIVEAVRGYVENSALCRQHGQEARRVIEQHFAIQAMVEAYLAVYDDAMAARRRLG